MRQTDSFPASECRRGPDSVDRTNSLRTLEIMYCPIILIAALSMGSHPIKDLTIILRRCVVKNISYELVANLHELDHEEKSESHRTVTQPQTFFSVHIKLDRRSFCFFPTFLISNLYQ